MCCIPESWFLIFLSERTFRTENIPEKVQRESMGFVIHFNVAFLLSSSFLLLFSPFYCLVFSHLPCHNFLFLLPFLLWHHFIFMLLSSSSFFSYDIPLLRAVQIAVTVPVIASSGAGKREHWHTSIKTFSLLIYLFFCSSNQ